MKENKEKRDLDKVIRQPSRLRKERSILSSKELKSPKEEVKDTEKVAQAKSSKSEQFFMDANCYFYGEGTKKDVEKAIDLYEEAARLGNVNACMALGNFYENGLGERVDNEMAAYYYKIAADLKQPYAMYKTAQFIEKGVHQCKTESEARDQMFLLYRSAMEHGNPDATIRLAQIYEKGEHGVKVNKQEALKLYQEVAHDDEAMNSIGSILYERGDFKRAAELFRKAAEKGNATGINNLGTCYELGKGLKADVNKAYELYEEAAKKGNAQAMSNLGYLCYKRGKISSSVQQFEEAAHWFRYSISEDYSIRDSHYYLGAMHQNGDGVEQ